MIIKYKTIIWEKDGQLIYDVKDINFCCSDAKNAYDNNVFIFNDHNNKQDHNLYIKGENSHYETISLKIDYCPFCKAEIKTEEIEKVKTIRKTTKETIEIEKVVFEEIPIKA
jgi:hypothetical protein